MPKFIKSAVIISSDFMATPPGQQYLDWIGQEALTARVDGRLHVETGTKCQVVEKFFKHPSPSQSPALLRQIANDFMTEVFTWIGASGYESDETLVVVAVDDPFFTYHFVNRLFPTSIKIAVPVFSEPWKPHFSAFMGLRGFDA